MRSIVAVLAAWATPVVAAATLMAPQAAAQPQIPPPIPPAGAPCNNPNCTPGIAPNIVLGSYCNNSTYYAFGVTSWGRLVFCGSARRYEPRWFRSPEMHGVKNLYDLCPEFVGEVAQAPDGLFLTCVAMNNRAYWERGDLPLRGTE
ncbi:hypothetical protein O6P37_07570 [Mycobacterium sp. CPCC 205372]|jgi:hypothetical protein|uniref:Secreted protein n=1 Tax=Mycobacterium hippophais TaxID=3016340 RepID=A0ABT4PQF3_9MYCO|nr:hypothetical protein [Mycobacterium hippophais]MCZ8378711.1 hypothetical protein [Mycobacterium hippophais]